MQTIYIWKQAPFLRLVIPFMVGIILQWYTSWPACIGWILFCSGVAGLAFFNRRISFRQYKRGWFNGIFINMIFLATGLLITYYKDISHQQQWLNHYYQDKDMVIAVLQEPLSEKANSCKANASVEKCMRHDAGRQVTGNIIIYFKKDSALDQLGDGTKIVFNKPLQRIRNAGNPAAFDYERYAALQGIYQQVFLQTGEYRVLPDKQENRVMHFLFATRQKVLKTITTYIPGAKEAGLAEALLVGYKDDLDKTLVQSYSNTGVVHIIAISGMHLGLIYWLLNMIMLPFKNKKRIKWAAPVITIIGLWLFSLLAGGGPSILRSAVMFTCIVIGESIERKTFIYNSLAASAFILLCINPFWLWDAGFQLSYTAVLSIVIFMKPVYHWFYFENKMMDAVWKLTAVSLAAQVLTTPVSVYHFHQFPVYFLITNLLAVPLSSLIVLLEIFLCVLAGIPFAANFTGIIIHRLIYTMNSFIEYMENLPLSLWNNLQIDVVQVILLYAFIISICYWLMKMHKPSLLIGLVWLAFFFSIRTWSFIHAGQQQQLVVYNIPKHHAVDFISSRNYLFEGDSELQAGNPLITFHMSPYRTQQRVSAAESLPALAGNRPFLLFNDKKILLIDKAYNFSAVTVKTEVDLIILSANAPITITDLLAIFNCRHIVIDGSNTARQVNKWKAEAAKLGLDCFCTVDNGAFVMNMD